MTNQPDQIEFNNLYRDVTSQLTSVLIGTVNIIITILVLYVYPLDRFGILDDKSGEYISVLNSFDSSQVLLIILTITLGLLLNYYYLTVAENLSQRVLFILHNIILLNIIIASAIIELPYFTTIALSVYILATLYIGRVRDNTWIITPSILLSNIAMIGIWYIKWINSQNINPIEIASTQIMIFAATILLKKSFRQDSLLHNIPLISNVMLSPLFQISEISGIYNLSVSLFAIFMILNLVNVLLVDEHSITIVSVISSTILFSVQYLINASFSDNILLSIDLLDMNFNALVYIVFIMILTLIAIKSNDNLDLFITTIIFITTLFFTINTIMQNTNSVNQMVLSTGYIYLSIFMRPGNKNTRSIPLMQTAGLFLLSFNPNILPYIQNVTFILFVLITLSTSIKLKEIKWVYHITIGSIGLLVLLNVIFKNISSFSTINNLLLTLAVLLPGILFVTTDKLENVSAVIIIQTILLYSLSFTNPVYYFRISVLDMVLTIFSAQLLLTFIKFREKDRSLLLTSIPTSILAMLYIIRLDRIIPNIISTQVIVLLVILPSIIMHYSKENEYKPVSMIIQAIMIATLTILPKLYLWDNISLISLLYSLVMIFGVISWYMTRDTNSIVILGLLSMLLQIFFVITPSIHIPESYLSGWIILILSSVIYLSDDIQLKISIAYEQAISVFILGYYSYQLSDNISIQGLTFSPMISLVFLGFVTITMISTIKKDEFNVLNTIILLSLMYSFFGLTSGINQIPPVLILSAITMVFIIIYNKSGIEFKYGYIFGAISIYLLTLQKNQLAVVINSTNIGIVSLMYMAVSLVFLQTWRKNQIKGVYSGISLAILNLLIIINGTLIPIELITVNILLLSIIPLSSSIDRYTRGAIVMYGVLITGILINAPSIQSIITISPPVLNTLLLITYCLTAIILMLKTDDSDTWIYSLSLYIIIIFVSSMNIGIMHPVTIGISILMLSYLSYKSSYIRVREFIPAVQAFALLLLLTNDIISNSLISYTSIFTVIWASLTLLIWYLKGTSRQLTTSYLSIYSLIAVYNIISLVTGIFIVDELLLIVILLAVTVFTIVFYSNLSKLRGEHLLLMLVTTGITLILFSQNIKYLSTYVLVYRLILDWMIFIPILAESTLFIKKHVQMMDDTRKGEMIIVTIQAAFVVVALLMGAEGIYSLKLLAIAISFWIFTTTFIHKYLSWATSINTVFTLSFVLAQTPSSGDSSEIFYFLILSTFGIIMVILALINETKYHGEPLTASLVTTGAVFTAITILAPLLRGNSFPTDMIDLNTGNQIINFLPNIVWAIQGLGLFIFSMRYSKDYLRKFALSILLLDIIKTAMDIFILDNIFIRSFGSFILGLVLILIFYLFTNDDRVLETNK